MDRTHNLLQGLLQLADASDGRIETRIRLQKEAYLLASAGFSHISKDTFTYHHYGPFSRELSDSLQFAVLSGLLEETKSQGADGGTKYSYVLSAQGRAYIAECGPMEEKFADIVKACSQHHWRTLELAATASFLVSTESMKLDDAFGHALELKPETLHYRDKASDLLSQIAA